nr:DUF1540 domain-containing protein [Maliibacterium massiliense]
MSNPMGKQCIYCDVRDCRFNREGQHCSLETIQVACCHDAHVDTQEDSMCASFRCK